MQNVYDAYRFKSSERNMTEWTGVPILPRYNGFVSMPWEAMVRPNGTCSPSSNIVANAAISAGSTGTPNRRQPRI